MRKGNSIGVKRESGEEKTDDNSGQYIIASSRPPKRRSLERRILVPITSEVILNKVVSIKEILIESK